MIQPPKPDEYFEYYGGYIRFVPAGADVFALMAAQPEELRTLLRSVNEAQAEVRPAPGEWSIKEVLGHITDTERVMSYRALWIARGNTTPIPGFDQDDFVRATDFNRRSLSDLLDEFAFHRQANLLCFRPLTEAEIDRRGTASGYPFSVRALLYILPGHVMHHIESLKRDYHVGG
ncbi:MAG: DinB family protein [Anaerolineae bacterium]|nr:DinB family protein [Anaerolineae bacterium]